MNNNRYHGEFVTDFAQWLKSAGFEFTHQLDKATYDRFEITGKRRISVICLSISSWIDSGNKHPLQIPDTLPEIPDVSSPVLIWEDLWHRKPEIIKSRLQALLGFSITISARKTYIRRIDKPTADQFLEAHHMHGPTAARYRIGLFLPRKYFMEIPREIHQDNPDHVLVAVAAFAAPRTFVHQGLPHKSGELIRFASFSGTTITGGLSKLTNHFARQYGTDDIMTYVDLEWSTGPSFLKSGFVLTGRSQPIDFLIHRVDFTRYPLHKLDNKIIYGPEGKNLVPICNAGNLKYVKKYHFPDPVQGQLPATKSTLVDTPAPPYDITLIVGPTASGKTGLAVRLAYELGGEILSLDSRQIYQNMDIGTGKDLDSYQLEDIKIPYHLIDIVPPGTHYSVHQFKQDFKEAYRHLQKKGKPIIACGGSGLYIEAVLNLLSTEFTSVRYQIIALNPPPHIRKTRIEKRLQERLKNGLIEEVKSLLENGVKESTLINYGLEYKHVTLYLQDRVSREEMARMLLTDIYRFSKRQLTFLRKIERIGYKIQWI